jgi:hypothetical protein
MSPAATTATPHPLADLALARRLERVEGKSNAAFVEARERLHPGSGACWREVAGTYAMFDGVGSPLTQTFGLALFAPAREEDLAELEAFFAERGADVFHEVSPLADVALLGLLSARGYHPMELSSVLCRTLDGVDGRPRRASEVRARRIEPGEEERWAEISAQGWGETPAAADFLRQFGTISAHAHGVACWLAELDGRPIGAGAMTMHDGVALLAGASTIPAWRGRGAQGVLLAARLAHAAASGVELAMMVAMPGSVSQLNAERAGFRMAYTRTKWQKR